jgi:hypothetical protein
LRVLSLTLFLTLPPSLTLIQSELMEDYFKNAATNIRIEHEQETGANTLIFD